MRAMAAAATPCAAGSLLGDEGGEQDGCNFPPGSSHSSAENLLMNLEGTELKHYSQFSLVPVICTYKHSWGGAEMCFFSVQISLPGDRGKRKRKEKYNVGV